MELCEPGPVEIPVPMRSPVLTILLLTACTGATPSPSDAGAGAGGGSAGTGGGSASSTRTLGPDQAGVATFYSADGSGSCSFGASPADLDVAAMNAAQWNNSAVCGGCVRVDGPKGSVTVRIVDQCPDCASGTLDLSAQAFAKIADPVGGRVNVRWQPMSCAVQGAVVLRFKEGSSRYWTGLQVRNTRIPVRSLEVEKSGAFVNVPRESYNYFVDSSGFGPGPLTLRITGDDGQQLLETGVMLRESGDVMGTQQFQ